MTAMQVYDANAGMRCVLRSFSVLGTHYLGFNPFITTL